MPTPQELFLRNGPDAGCAAHSFQVVGNRPICRLDPIFVRFVRLATPSRLAGFCIFGIAALVPASGAPAPDAPAAIVVGAPSDSYPYCFQDGTGKLDGFAVDLFDAVARAMDLNIRRAVMPSRELQARFVNGDFDVMQAYSRSPSREAIAEFTVPYLTLQGCVFVRKDGPVHRYEDLNGLIFAIIGRGSTGEAFLRDHHIQATQRIVSSSEEALRWVQQGACAGTFVSRLTALSVIDHEHLTNLTIVGAPLPDYEIRQCFAVHKGNAKLLAALNEGMAIVHRTGEFDQIYRRWFGRIDAPLLTRQQIILYVVTALALALIAAMGGFFWQRTLRKRITRQAAELAGERALLQALYDHIPMGMTVIALAPDGPRLVSMNREAGRLYGVDPEKMINRPLAGLPLPATSRSHFDEVLRRGPPGEQIVHYEHGVEGSRRVLEVTIVPLSPEPGESPRLCILTEDISARKLLDAEVAQSRKLRAVGELVGGIAHEFNNLLTPMMLKVGEIQMDWSQDARLQQEIVVISQAAQRAADLTRRLLTFGRKSDARVDSVQLAELVANCFELLRPAMDRRIVWESDVPDGLPPLRFNGTELNQVLINLLLNARDTLMEKLRMGHDDGWVPRIQVAVKGLPADAASPGKALSGSRLAGWQQLTVADNGLGMAPAVVERIFEPFFTTKEVGKGTGLGLATVWHLVTDAGGRVDVESKPGTGTTFSVLLPVVKSAVEAAAAKPDAARTSAPAPASVFLVEDEDLVAQTVTAILRRGGHAVHHLSDGAAAWKHLAAAADSYQLLVIDVNLPGMSGVDIVSRVRERNFSGKILVISGRLGMSNLRSLVQLHVDRVLPKPFTAAQFEAALRECLD